MVRDATEAIQRPRCGVIQCQTRLQIRYFHRSRKAAEQGYVEAQFSLGVCYFDGVGVPKDNEEAIKWWYKAAKQGYTEALKRIEEERSHNEE